MKGAMTMHSGTVRVPKASAVQTSSGKRFSGRAIWESYVGSKITSHTIKTADATKDDTIAPALQNTETQKTAFAFTT